MNEITEGIAKAVGVIVIIFAVAFGFSFLLAYPVMLLWNACIPEIFGLKEIAYWNAWQLSFLCSLLFKGGNVNTSK